MGLGGSSPQIFRKEKKDKFEENMRQDVIFSLNMAKLGNFKRFKGQFCPKKGSNRIISPTKTY